MKNIEAEILVNTLQALVMKEMPVKGSLAVTKNIRKLTDEIQEYTKKKNELIIKYGRPNENGNYEIKADNREALDKLVEELTPISEMEINVELVKIRYSDLPETLTPKQLTTLMDYMIEDEEENRNEQTS